MIATSLHCPCEPASQPATPSKNSRNPRLTTHRVQPAFIECALWDKLGRLHLTALVDTGATFSIVAREHAKQISYGREQRVQLADGTLTMVNKLTCRTVQIGSRVVEHIFYVMNDAPAPIILGLDFLDLHDIDIMSKQRYIKFVDSEEQIPLLTSGKSRILAAAMEIAQKSKDTPQVVDKDYPPPVVGNAPLTAAQRAEATQLLHEHKYCFASRDKPIGKVTCIYHRVRPRGAPFKARLAALSPKELAEQQKCLQQMVDLGVARPSHSDWASRPSFAPKKDGTTRFCLNFRRLNQFDEKDNYPLPRAPDLIERLGKKKFFSSLDAVHGYWQIPIHPDDIKYTAVITQQGLYEFVRMPFGLSNAPATYQRLMDTILKEGLRQGFCCVYLDDVLIYSDTFDEHCVHLQKVLKWMSDSGLLLKGKKCSFFDATSTYLGHIVGNGQVKMTTDKIRKVIDFPKPKTLQEVQSFLGVTGYYRKFIKAYAKLANPLNNLTHKNTKFAWTDEHDESFEILKKMFNANVPLQMPDYTRPFIVDTDASDIAVGAVLGQLDDNGNERPVFFASRKLSPAEKKWPVRDKEALAILFACQSFRHHILGTHFTVRSDHHSLQWLMEAQTGRIARWATMLAEYEPFDIKYRRGESNKVADALSRVYAWSECMPDIAFCATAMQDGDSNERLDDDSLHIDPPDVTQHIDIPSHRKLLTAQAADDFCIKQRVKQLDNKPDLPNARGYVIRDNLLGLERQGRFLPILPEIFRDKFLREVHSHPMTAHMGARRVAARAGEIYAIPQLRKYCREICATCDPCLRRKKPQPKVGQLASRPPTKAWEQISMDYCGPYPPSVSQKKFVLVIIDQFTKYVHLTPCHAANARTAYRTLYEKILCHYGTPQKILTDNGAHFRNKWLAAVCAEFKIVQTFSSPYYPQGDGQVERFMRNMNDSLSALCSDEPTRWCNYVAGVQSAYNMTPHAATFVSPHELLYGHPPPPLIRLEHALPAVPITKDADDEAKALRRPMDEVRERVRKQIEKSWMQRALTYNMGRKKLSIVVGDRCLVRLTPAQLQSQIAGKLKVRWSQPVKITNVKQSGQAFDVLTRDGRTIVVNASRLLPLPPSHWTPKATTRHITWDEEDYQPQFPGPSYCSAAPVTSSETAASTQGQSFATDASQDVGSTSTSRKRTASVTSLQDASRSDMTSQQDSALRTPPSGTSSAQSATARQSSSSSDLQVVLTDTSFSNDATQDTHQQPDARHLSPTEPDDFGSFDDGFFTPISDGDSSRGTDALEVSSSRSRVHKSTDSARQPLRAPAFRPVQGTILDPDISDSSDDLQHVQMTSDHSPSSATLPRVREQ